MPDRKAQYTIRGVAPNIDHALRAAARDRHLSLNAYLVEELERIADEGVESGRHHDLDFLIGSMPDSALVDEALRAFTVIDEELWK